MNGFLVVGCSLDRDIPMGFFLTEKQATEFAKRQTVEAVIRAASNVFSDCVSEVVCVQVVPLRSGVFRRSKVVLDFDRDRLRIVAANL